MAPNYPKWRPKKEIDQLIDFNDKSNCLGLFHIHIWATLFFKSLIVQSVGAAEYIDCFSAEG